MKIKNLLIVLLCFFSVFFATGCNNNAPNKDGNITPVIKITTENNAPIVSKEDYLDAKITLSDNKGNINLDNVDAGVRGRGNYTWTLDKKGYRIKFNKKQAMLSDYKCKSWALLPNYTDKTLLRNYYALNVAKNMDGFAWSSNAELVELYLNNEYLGVYLLCDQTQVNENRVNIEEGYKSVKLIKEYAKKTMSEYVLNGLGSFAGMVELPEGYKKPVLVSGTDGVGTKLKIAFEMDKHDTVGIDCVAMCVNDIACARVVMEGWHGMNFVDFHHLMKTEDGWKIVSKIYTQI